ASVRSTACRIARSLSRLVRLAPEIRACSPSAQNRAKWASGSWSSVAMASSASERLCASSAGCSAGGASCARLQRAIASRERGVPGGSAAGALPASSVSASSACSVGIGRRARVILLDPFWIAVATRATGGKAEEMMRLNAPLQGLLLAAVVLTPLIVRATCPSGDIASCGSRGGAGDAAGCASLGAVYMQGGNGVARNDRRAVQLLRKACDGGSAKGCSDLRAMYSSGRGVGRNYDKDDVERYQRACGTGTFAACADLGRMYQYGRGVPTDRTRAIALYRQACGAGPLGGCRSACKLGDASSCGGAQKSP